ncbi:MAG: membrane anchored protein in chemotaxis locus [Shewanella sp.]
MAKVSSTVSTNIVLIWVLLAIGIFALGGLTLDYRHKIALLKAEVKHLEASQVLLMVPEQHAEAIATWLTQHPEQTQLMLAASAQSQVNSDSIAPRSVILAPDAVKNSAPPLALAAAPASATGSVEQTSAKAGPHAVPIVISENADGVKVIRLPEGGIRVTTRNAQ